ncbi:MAG: SpoIIE family protein phosphatase [Akkermansiaceae bacterium]|nr:SpoIIE family protein phosphatase [Akkermansiaceae bacterium]NNM28443.1 SpoIIE family protein phosphatase [Akkermansiaceae bacterium]
MKELKDGIRSEVRIDFEGRVHKCFRGHEKEKRCENEAHILRALEERGCPYVPRLLDHDQAETTIVTTNCGQPAPGISRERSDALFAELEREFGVRHDDPEPRNVTYSEELGRFCLIDFELATLLPDPHRDPGYHPTPAPGSARLRWAALTDSGSYKQANDDAWIALEVAAGRCERLGVHGERFLDPHPLLFAVADGIGGGRAGELASRLVLAGMRRMLPDLFADGRHTDWEALLNALVSRCHHDINTLAAREANLEKMGCTLTLACFEDSRLHLAHVGDSRLYRLRDGSLDLLTDDHTFAFKAWKRGRLSEREFRLHPRRSALYEALGGGHPQIFPQVATIPTQPADRYLLCTDGLIDGLWDGPLAQTLGEGHAEACAEALLRKARASCQHDDATLIVVDLPAVND